MLSGDDIPIDLLREANKHPSIKGFVRPTKALIRLAISDAIGIIIGFRTIKELPCGSIRIGPSYVKESHRGNGYSSSHLRRIFRDKRCVCFVSAKNIDSIRSVESAGFKSFRRGNRGCFYERKPC